MDKKVTVRRRMRETLKIMKEAELGASVVDPDWIRIQKCKNYPQKKKKKKLNKFYF